MAEAVVQRATRQLELTAVETLQDVPGASGATVTNDEFNVAPANYTPTSTIPVSRCVYIDETLVALTGSLVTIDLTACPGGAQDNIDGTGKKIQRVVLINTGTGTLTLGPGSANKYHLFGTDVSPILPARYSSTVFPSLDLWAPEGLADISATVKNLGITGTAGQSYQLALWFG